MVINKRRNNKRRNLKEWYPIYDARQKNDIDPTVDHIEYAAKRNGKICADGFTTKEEAIAFAKNNSCTLVSELLYNPDGFCIREKLIWAPEYGINESKRNSRRRNLKEKLVLFDDDQEVRYGEVRDLLYDMIEDETLDPKSMALHLVRYMSEDDAIDFCKMYEIIDEVDD